MKRKMKLIRKLLQYAENNATGILIEAPEYRDYSDEEVHYHIGLCIEAGYLHANQKVASDPARYLIRNLTWRGHEELERLNQEVCQP